MGFGGWRDGIVGIKVRPTDGIRNDANANTPPACLRKVRPQAVHVHPADDGVLDGITDGMRRDRYAGIGLHRNDRAHAVNGCCGREAFARNICTDKAVSPAGNRGADDNTRDVSKPGFSRRKVAYDSNVDIKSLGEDS